MTCGMVSSLSRSSSCSSSVAQLRRMDTQVLRRLHIRHAAFLDQPHSLKLELARKLPSLHDPPPAPSKHLTRCLRNRVQATSMSCSIAARDITNRAFLAAVDRALG